MIQLKLPSINFFSSILILCSCLLPINVKVGEYIVLTLPIHLYKKSLLGNVVCNLCMYRTTTVIQRATEVRHCQLICCESKSGMKTEVYISSVLG